MDMQTSAFGEDEKKQPTQSSHPARIKISAWKRKRIRRIRLANEARLVRAMATELMHAFRQEAQMTTDRKIVLRKALFTTKFRDETDGYRSHSKMRIYTNIKDPLHQEKGSNLYIDFNYCGSVTVGSGYGKKSTFPAGDEAISDAVNAVFKQAARWASVKVYRLKGSYRLSRRKGFTVSKVMMLFCCS